MHSDTPPRDGPLRAGTALDVAAVQRLLERIYAIESDHRVEDFLVTDPALAALLDTSADARPCEEKLLLQEDDDGLSLSLFIDAAVVERLGRSNPLEQLHEHNLADFCTALEGVSHFLYLIHRAVQSRPVTLLEMELQAEVDKYVSVHALLGEQGAGVAPRNLLRRLFEQVRLDHRLAGHERGRYATASAYASRYCDHLERRFLGSRSPGDYYQELRTFYHLDQPRKLSHIRRTPAA